MDNGQLWQILLALAGAAVGWLLRHKFGATPLTPATPSPSARPDGQMLDQLLAMLRQVVLQAAAHQQQPTPSSGPGEITVPVKVKVQAQSE